MKTLTAIKLPGGYLASICEVTGEAVATKTLANAETYKSADLARAVSRFLIGNRCVSTSGIYPFRFNAKRAA